MNAVEQQQLTFKPEQGPQYLTPEKAWGKIATLCELSPSETMPATAEEYLNNLRYSWIFCSCLPAITLSPLPI